MAFLLMIVVTRGACVFPFASPRRNQDHSDGHKYMLDEYIPMFASDPAIIDLCVDSHRAGIKPLDR